MKALLLKAVLVSLALALAVCAAPAFAGPPGPLPAPNTLPQGELMVVHATQFDAGGSIDPRIGRLPVGRAPFKSYNTFKLIGVQLQPLEKGKPVSYPLPDGSTITLTLLDVTSDGRYRLAAGLDDKTKIEVTASPGDPFFLAGQRYGDGILVLGITVRK